MNITKHTILTLLALMLTLFTACRDEEAVTMPDMEGAGLYVALTVSGETPTLPTSSTTRANVIEGETELDENMVKRMDFFLFNSAGTTLKKYVYKERTPSTTTEETSTTETNKDGQSLKYYTTSDYCTLYTSDEWTSPSNCLSEGDILYALVNVDWSKASVTDPASITTLSALKALTYTDDNIYLKKQTNGEKPFLMAGYHTFTSEEIAGYSSTSMNQVTVDVERAAAKVKVNIFKNANWKTWENNQQVEVASIGTVTASLQNYASHTQVVKEGDAPADRKLANVKHTPADGKTAITTYDAEEANKTNATYACSVLFYTFANNWTGNSKHETSLELNIPYTTTVNDVTYNRNRNFYKIVFMPNDGKLLKRNTFYEVDIDVKNDGATVSEEPVEITNLQWKVSPWQTETLDVEEEQAVDYLILSDYYIDLRNEAEVAITFYSSAPVTVSVVGFSKESELQGKPNTNEDVTILQSLKNAGFEGYPGKAHSKSGYMEIPGVFYVDKESRRINIADDIYSTARAYYGDTPVQAVGYAEEADRQMPADGDIVLATWDNNATKEGTIHLYSRIPENVTPRYITLKVTMPTKNGSLTRYAVIEQYPLEYVVGVQGLYSYMDGAVKSRNNASELTEYNISFGEGNKSTDKNGNPIFYAWDFETSISAIGKPKPDTIIIPKNIVYGPTNKTSNEWGTTQGSYGLNNHMARYGNMKCKFFRAGDKWENSEGEHMGMIYQIDASYYNDSYSTMPVQIMNNREANNNNMYEVVVTATSTQYRIGYPEMVNEGSETAADLKVAVSSSENNELLAPRFAFASQLGNNSAMKLWETARDQCKHYVEVGIDGTVYDNWRLPTIAELSIIKNYQLDQNVYDITMNKVVNSDGDTNPRYWTAGEDVFVNTTGAGGKETQTYSYQVTVVTYKNTTLAADVENTRITKNYRMLKATWEAKDATYKGSGYQNELTTSSDWVLASTSEENGKKPKDSGHTADGTYYTVATEATPNIEVRCRCVRDIKIE